MARPAPARRSPRGARPPCPLDQAEHRRSIGRREADDRLAWLVSGALAATVLGATGLAGGRVLVAPDLGFAALVGVVIHRAVERGPWLARAFAALLVAAHGAIAPLAQVAGLARIARAAERIARTAALEPRGPSRRDAASEPGGRARRARVHRRGGEGEVALLVWRDHRLRRFELPAVGETVDLPWSAGPSRRFGGR